MDLQLNDYIGNDCASYNLASVQDITDRYTADIDIEDMPFSQEGIFSAISEWFRKRREARIARKREEDRFKSIRNLEMFCDWYCGVLDSLSGTSVKMLDGCLPPMAWAVQLATKVTAAEKVFMAIDPLKYRSRPDVIKAISNKLNVSKPVLYVDLKEDALIVAASFSSKAKSIKLAGTSWDKTAAVKALFEKFKAMDNGYWDLDMYVYNTINKFNNWANTTDVTDVEFNAVRKGLVTYVNWSDAVLKAEAGLYSGALRSMHAVFGSN